VVVNARTVICPTTTTLTMSAGADALSTYEEEANSILSSLTRKVDRAESTPDGTERASLCVESETDVADVERVVRQMVVELRHLPFNSKQRHQQRVNELQQRSDVQRERLVGIKKSRPRGEENREQRGRLLQAKQAIDDSGESLDNTLSAISESSATGAQTAIQLQQQRDQLQNAKQNLHETDNVLGRSRKLLIRMRRRIITNKLITGVIILSELALMALIVYLKYYK